MDALKRFSRDRKNGCENVRVFSKIKNAFYWQDLKELMVILEPLHEAQIMSESSKGHIY